MDRFLHKWAIKPNLHCFWLLKGVGWRMHSWIQKVVLLLEERDLCYHLWKMLWFDFSWTRHLSLSLPPSLVQSDNFHSNSNLQFLKMLVEMFVRNSLQRLSEKIDYTFQLRTRLNHGILTALVMLTITSVRTWMEVCITSDSVTFLDSVQCHQSLCSFGIPARLWIL